MLQSSRAQQQSNQNQRLPKQSGVPSYDDIFFVMEKAQKSKGKPIELPYCTPGNGCEFLLAVLDKTQEDATEWRLMQVTSAGEQILWHHATRDVTLICNLVATSSGNEPMQDMMLSGRTPGKAQEPSAHSTQAQLPALSAEGGVIFEPPRKELKAILQGDLKTMPISTLMQSICQSGLNGRLDVRTRSENAEVYYANGNVMHCTVKETIGNNALIELVTWVSGEFRFWPDEKTSLRTVNKSLEALIGQGLALNDQAKYLETNGLRLESCLVKKNALISEEELKDRLSKGVPVEMETQLDFYELIDNRNTLFALLKERPFNKCEWVPILFNLVSLGLVQISDQPPQQNRLANLKTIGVDEMAVQNIAKSMIKPESGVLSFPAFIYFLDQEYLRYEFFNLPFSVIIFSMGQKNSETGQVYALQSVAIRRAMQRVSLVKRQVDLLGHFGDYDYAMLLPSTNSAAATALAHKVTDVLKEAPLSSELDARSLALAFGVATVPEDCQAMDKLIAIATKARDQAKTVNRIVVQAREITA